MNEIDSKQNIKSAIDSFAKGNLSTNGINLFKSLGYNTERQTSLNKPTYKEFEENYVVNNIRFNSEKALVKEWKYVDLLFQLSKGELLNQKSLFDTGRVDDKIIESYLFITIELSRKNYSRTELSSITREVNKLFAMPVMVLFKYDNLLTLSIINRRLHKRDDSKDVLQKVTLIKDINIDETNRAHIEILFDLSFDELNRRYDFRNFVELDEAWQVTLDTKELNNKFFEKISNWFYWASTKVKFKDKNFHSEITEDNANYLIKIISRLIFIYFLKERKLIPEDLFYKDKIFPLIDKNEPNGTSYYKAILQNLFFGILNNPISNQRFKKLKSKIYLSEEAAIEKLFVEIPFVNGGLFDMGDEPYSNSESILTVPDDLFFGKEREIDLSKFFPKRKKAKVEGIINILNHYKFTIEENTPIEEEIALDPELLGKVFENLLAAINPHTGTTVRKATGSYYTPREIVDYMVTESLTLYLKSKVKTDTQHKWNEANIETKIHDLLSYGFGNPFNPNETERIIIFLDELKILDPACGSGAFPMGLLNKIVFALNKLDPEAKKWLELILDKIPNSSVRTELKQKLEKEDWNYIRKLGIIQDTIYGVDILPFAIQISKLRFYISLIVDQKVDKRKENKGIIPLPNLEFKLVCSNSLIPLPEENKQANLFHDNTVNIEELKQVRDEYFRSYGDVKNEAIKHFKRIQVKIMNEATKGLSKGGSIKENRDYELAAWNPFGDNKTSWFDMQWMFGIDNGFDIIIGNPPYIGQSGNKEIFREVLQTPFGKLFHQRRMDYFYFFYHRAILLAKNHSGVITFITTNYFLNATYADKLRKHIFENCRFSKLLNFNEAKLFENATGQHNAISVLVKDENLDSEVKTLLTTKKSLLSNSVIKSILSWEDTETNYFKFNTSQIFEGDKHYIRIEGSVNHGSSGSESDVILSAIMGKNPLLIDVAHIFQGIVTGANDLSETQKAKYSINAKDGSGIFVLSDGEIENLDATKIEKQFIKPWFKNSDISQWICNETTDKNLIYFTSTDLQKDIEIPNLISHFKKFKPLLINRNVRTGSFTTEQYDKFVKGNLDIPYVMVKSAFKRGRYFCVSYARDKFIFESPKIICPQRSPLNTFGYTETPWYAASDVYYIIEKENPKVRLKYLLALLNSKLYFYWLYNKGQRKGEILQLFKDPLSEIPVKIPNEKQQNILEIVSDYILFCKTERENKKTLSSLVDSFFVSLSNLIVYEIYFPDILEQANSSVIKHLSKLKDLATVNSYDNKIKLINETYKSYSAKDSPVREALYNLDTIELIKKVELKFPNAHNISHNK